MKLPPKSISYGKYILKIMSPDDGPAIFCAVNNSLSDLKKFMNWAHFEGNIEQACSIYGQFQAKTLMGTEAHFIGFDKESTEVIFCCSLTPNNRLNPAELELGYWVTSKNTGHGIGTLAAQIMIVLAFEYYEADRLSVVSNTQNEGSLKVIRRCGFQFEGILRNHLGKPSQIMIENGYSAVRDVSCFSLISEDLKKLSWHEEIRKNMTVYTFFSSNTL